MALSDYITPKKEEYLLSEENGKAEVRRLLDFLEVEFDVSDTNEKAVRATEKFLDRITLFYRLGLLENKEDGDLGFCVAQHTSKGSTITYREPKGGDVAIAEKIPSEETSARAWAIMGRLSGLGEDAIKKLTGRDRQAMMGLSEIFLWG